jgi:hypothetical protein
MKTQKNKKNDNQNYERNIQKVISVKTSLVSLAIGAILMIATATLMANAAYALSPVYTPGSYPTDPYSGAASPAGDGDNPGDPAASPAEDSSDVSAGQEALKAGDPGASGDAGPAGDWMPMESPHVDKPPTE